MSNFIYDIQLGFLAFPLVAIILAMPYALYQYRRFGAISIWKTFVVFTFILYCLCAISLVVFPLPADHTAVVESARTPQTHPFYVLEQIRETIDFSLADRSTWGPTLRSPVVYEAIFNVMLTMPLGAYLCYLFRCRWWMALLIGFGTTLLFETSQLTGLFGLYAHPYRLFDVDDLILNTTGAMLGFWLMIPLSWALPSMTEVNERSIERGTSRVTLTRRLIAVLVDLTILIAVFAVAWIMLSPTDAQIAKALAINPSRAGAKTLAFRFIGGLVADPATALLILLVIGAVLFAIIPMATKGRTIGNAIVGIRIVKANGQDAPVLGYWMRYLASAFFCLIPVAVVLLAPEEIEGMSTRFLFQIVGLVVVVWLLTIVGRVIGSFSGYPYVSLAEAVSGTRLAPSKQTAGNRVPQGRVQQQSSSSQASLDEPASANDNTASPQGAYRSAAERPNLSDAVPGNTVVFNGQTARQTEQQGVHRDQSANINQNPAATSDDYGKQAALDSLLAVNYDEQHPVGNAPADRAPTQIIPGAEAPTQMISDQPAQEAPTQLINNDAMDKTELISGPETHRKIRRDQRPDAGGTQVFKRQ